MLQWTDWTGLLLRPWFFLQGIGSVPLLAWSFSTVALIVLLQGIYCNPPLCSRHTNQPGSAWPIGPCSAPDAIRNPPHTYGLSLTQAASPASGVRRLSGWIWALAQTPPPLTPPPGAARAPLHLPGTGHGHARSKESSVEPALQPHRTRQVKWPRKNQQLMPLHQHSLVLQIFPFRITNGSKDIVWSKICRRGEEIR